MKKVIFCLLISFSLWASPTIAKDSLKLVEGKKKCPEGTLTCPNHQTCCPANNPWYCSYHKGLKRSHICGEDIPEIHKQLQSQCNSSERCVKQ